MTVTDLPTPQVRNISNSEVTAFLACKRMYYYNFMLDLAPKNTPDPLARGSLGHLAFQNYVEARLNSSGHELAMKAGLATFQEAMANTSIDVVMQTQFLWTRYMEYHQGWPTWTLLGTEQRLDLRLTETLYFPIRYDLYFLDKNDGKKKLLDFKYTYDFWQVWEHDTNGQMPKYIAVMQANGHDVQEGVLEEIRTRPLGAEKSSDPKNLWKRTPYRPSNARRMSMLRQHVAASLEIEKFRALPDAEREVAAIPVLNKHGACKYCNFKDLCVSEIEGKKDLSVDIRVNYVKNTYGYNDQNTMILGDLL